MNKKIISCSIIVILFATAGIGIIANGQQAIELQTLYIITLKVFKNDTTTLLNISATNGTISFFSPNDVGYSIREYSNTNEELFRGNTYISFSLITDAPVSILLNSTVVQYKIPVYSNAHSISLYHLNKKIFDLNLSNEFCNSNLICEPGENQYNCPQDCTPAQQTSNISFYIYPIILIVGIISLIFLIIRHRKLRKYNNLKQKWS